MPLGWAKSTVFGCLGWPCVFPWWSLKGCCAVRKERKQQAVEIVMECLETQCGDLLIEFKVLKPPVGSHPGSTQPQGIKQPAAHWLEIQIRQMHVPAFVLPVAD